MSIILECRETGTLCARRRTTGKPNKRDKIILCREHNNSTLCCDAFTQLKCCHRGQTTIRCAMRSLCFGVNEDFALADKRAHTHTHALNAYYRKRPERVSFHPKMPGCHLICQCLHSLSIFIRNVCVCVIVSILLPYNARHIFSVVFITRTHNDDIEPFHTTMCVCATLSRVSMRTSHTEQILRVPSNVNCISLEIVATQRKFS